MESNGISNNLQKKYSGISSIIINVISACPSRNHNKIYKKRNIMSYTFSIYVLISIYILLFLLPQHTLMSQSKICSELHFKSGCSRKLAEGSWNQRPILEIEYINAEEELWKSIVENMIQFWEETKKEFIDAWRIRSRHLRQGRWVQNSMENMLKKMNIELYEHLDYLQDEFVKRINILKREEHSNNRWNLWMNYMEWKETQKEDVSHWIRGKKEFFEEWMKEMENTIRNIQ